jgi:hypothetical protein
MYCCFNGTTLHAVLLTPVTFSDSMNDDCADDEVAATVFSTAAGALVIMAFRTGADVGRLVGRKVGTFVLMIGADVGRLVGLKVGPFVAMIGADVGRLVGLKVGTLVLIIGADVGRFVGETVGACVGDFVGVNVGVLVGARVGAFVFEIGADVGCLVTAIGVNVQTRVNVLQVSFVVTFPSKQSESFTQSATVS